MCPTIRRIVSFNYLVLALFVAGCATVPLDVPKSSSALIPVTTETHFGGLAAEWAAVNGQKSGFFPLAQGMDTLGARLRLAEKAEKSIDLQYFLMK
jgi:putative cardiolipin synthase